MPSTTPDAYEMFLIRAKGKVDRLNPLGDPRIEKFYHKTMTQGQFMESSIAHAMTMIQARKLEVQEHIQHYVDKVRLAIDGKNSDTPRAILYAADAMRWVKKIQQYVVETEQLIAAIQQNISILQHMEQTMLGAIQENLDAISTLLAEICNWGLPPLPSLPSLYDGLYKFNGFSFFPLGSLAKISMDFNFTFSQCKLQTPDLNILNNAPQAGPSGNILAFDPPLGGVSETLFSGDLSASEPAVYGSTFNPLTSMLGSVPDPATIVSQYAMPAATYVANIISIIPQTRGNVIPATALTATPTAQQTTNLRSDLSRFVTLDQVVASAYDPNLTAAWVLYMEQVRESRSGQWIPNLEAAYMEYVTPSVNYLSSSTIPWNNFEGTLSAGPAALPLVGVLEADSSKNIHWKLSYLEAGLLGYGRSRIYDAGADNVFLGSYTGTDTDFVSLTFDTSDVLTLTLGADTATYPVELIYPAAMDAQVQAAVAIAVNSIAVDTTYQTHLGQFKYVYDQFAQAKLVDRYTQFWRTWAYNFRNMMNLDGYVLGFLVSYADSIDSTVNPLTISNSSTVITTDANSRNRLWVKGSPVLNIPQAPVVSFTSMTLPTDATNGWSGSSFDPTAFLARPDIQALPLSTQLAMLSTSQNYAVLLDQQAVISQTIGDAITQAQSAAAALAPSGCHVLLTRPLDLPAGVTTPVPFDTLDFDTGHYQVDSLHYVIPSMGEYMVVGVLNLADDSGASTATILVGGQVVSTTTGTAGVSTLGVTAALDVEAGDMITISVSSVALNSLVSGDLYIMATPS